MKTIFTIFFILLTCSGASANDTINDIIFDEMLEVHDQIISVSNTDVIKFTGYIWSSPKKVDKRS